MNYKETVQYLFNSTPVFEHVGASAYKSGLENSWALDDHFGHPHTHFLTIHVAGTNGKGSCSHTLASILQADGYKVGLYTSPHLVDFRERIRVNGEMMPEQYVIDFVEKERAFFEPLHPSFFELTTALAFKYFAEQHVDIAVIEVGLGGRLDCTNIITPIMSIITNISMDHTQFLGHTLPEIAHEKAGIIKPRVPVVVGEAVAETRPVFEAKAQKEDATIVFAEDIPAVVASQEAHGGREYKTRYLGTIHGQLGGSYQTKNANTILTAVMLLLNKGVIRHVESVGEGFATVCERTGLMGRWQTIHDHPHAVCDTGHNVAGWEYLSRQIVAQPARTRRLVFGMVDDKDLRHVMAMLPQDAVYYWTQPSTQRAFPVEKVAECGLQYGLKGNSYPSVSAAYEAALADAEAEDFLFVGGSSYVVADLLAHLNTQK